MEMDEHCYTVDITSLPERPNSIPEPLFSAVFSALNQKKCLIIHYNSRLESIRRIGIEAVVERDSSWYIAAFCFLRNEYRTFSMEKVTQYEVTEDAYESDNPSYVKAIIENGLFGERRIANLIKNEKGNPLVNSDRSRQVFIEKLIHLFSDQLYEFFYLRKKTAEFLKIAEEDMEKFHWRKGISTFWDEYQNNPPLKRRAYLDFFQTITIEEFALLSQIASDAGKYRCLEESQFETQKRCWKDTRDEYHIERLTKFFREARIEHGDDLEGYLNSLIPPPKVVLEEQEMLARQNCPHIVDSGYDTLSLDNIDYIITYPKKIKDFEMSKFSGRDWSKLVARCPVLEHLCDWFKLDAGDWCHVLQNQPQFSKYLPSWNIFNSDCILALLRVQPQFSSFCDMQKLNSEQWGKLVAKQPQFSNLCPWESMDDDSIAWAVAIRPEFAPHCHWDTMDSCDASWILSHQPQLSDACNWSAFQGEDWMNLLSQQPQFAEKCQWSKLSSEDWCKLLFSQPQLGRYCDFSKIDVKSDWWAELVLKYPEFMRLLSPEQVRQSYFRPDSSYRPVRDKKTRDIIENLFGKSPPPKKRQHQLDQIRFFRKQAEISSLGNYTIGYSFINGMLMKDVVEINGKQPTVPAVLFSEFHAMLRKPGDYYPFTCTCGIPGDANINFPVRCFHKEKLIILVVREPVCSSAPCETCGSNGKCDLMYWECPFKSFHYHAYRFLKKDIEQGLNKLI